MRDVIFLIGRYAWRHRVTTAVLIATVTILLALPGALSVLIEQTRRQMHARARATPLLIGMRGSPIELTLSTLYFSAATPEIMPFKKAGEIDATGLARALPVYARFRAGGRPVVGVTLDYFAYRGLTIGRGSQMTRLGDCVLGAGAADALGLGPGDSIVTSPENAFDLAGVYPLKMRVTGVLAPAGTADDGAIFTDLKTTWVIQGLGHGHADLAEDPEAGAVMQRQGGRITANASVTTYREITPQNLDSFHFHGDTGAFPITAIIVDAPDAKSRTILAARYQRTDQPLQAVDALEVFDELMANVFAVQRYVVLAVALVGAGGLATLALVIALSIRLRAREIHTLARIGASPGRIRLLLAGQAIVVVTCSVVVAGAVVGALAWSGQTIIPWIVGRLGGGV